MKELEALMYKRGYRLVLSNSDKTYFCFNKITYTTNEFISCEVKDKDFKLSHMIVPGCITVSTSWCSPIENERHFKSRERELQKVLNKYYSL